MPSWGRIDTVTRTVVTPSTEMPGGTSSRTSATTSVVAPAIETGFVSILTSAASTADSASTVTSSGAAVISVTATPSSGVPGHDRVDGHRLRRELAADLDRHPDRARQKLDRRDDVAARVDRQEIHDLVDVDA